MPRFISIPDKNFIRITASEISISPSALTSPTNLSTVIPATCAKYFFNITPSDILISPFLSISPHLMLSFNSVHCTFTTFNIHKKRTNINANGNIFNINLFLFFINNPPFLFNLQINKHLFRPIFYLSLIHISSHIL